MAAGAPYLGRFGKISSGPEDHCMPASMYRLGLTIDGWV